MMGKLRCCSNLAGRVALRRRASVDAVIVVSALSGLFARSLARFEMRHFRAFAVLRVVLAGVAVVLYLAGNHLAEVAAPALQQLEADSSP